MSASLPEGLNIFNARFGNNSPAEEAQDPCPLVIPRADVCQPVKSVHPHKASGPDGIPIQALNVCALLALYCKSVTVNSICV